MSRAVLSIGANLGNRSAALRGTVRAFTPWLRAVSPVYETPPWGPVPQDDFLNAVLLVDDPAADARDWLTRAHDAEAAAGRTREVRWGPRAAERAFVLVPWLDVDADAMLGSEHVVDVLAALPAAAVAAVRRVEAALA